MPARQTAQERRKSPRYSVDMSVWVKIVSSAITGAFTIRNAKIREISADGLGLTVELQTPFTREEFGKMIVRRRGCIVGCSIPGSKGIAELYGDIMWVEPRMTSGGTHFQFGVALDKSFPEKLAAWRAYVKTLEARNAEKVDKALGH
jgi:hypothetical protein